MKKEIIIFSSLVIYAVNAHIVLNDPSPRTKNAGLTNFPCGDTNNGNVVKDIVTGSTFDVKFREPLPHDGTFRISWSERNENNWNVLSQDTKSNGVGDYTVTVTAPNTSCNNCVLQLILVTDQGNDYHSCSDVNFVSNNLCDNIDCLNEGICNEGICNCKQGFTGTRCQTSTNDLTNGGDNNGSGNNPKKGNVTKNMYTMYLGLILGTLLVAVVGIGTIKYIKKKNKHSKIGDKKKLQKKKKKKYNGSEV